jgi:multicomponent Na+:H+ antiporter subunit F
MTAFTLILNLLLAVLAVSLLLTVWRLLRGPSIPDRAMSFDMIMIHIVGLIAINALLVDQVSHFDAILIVALLGFLGTVAIARYIEEGRS